MIPRLLSTCVVFACLESVSTAQAVDFQKEVWPIFENKCVKCHQAPEEKDGKVKKPKGGLRLDGAWAILAGSEDGSVLTPGKSGESSLYLRVTLPSDDDDFMPPKDKADPLTETELALLKKWIDDGADFGGWEGNQEGRPAGAASTSTMAPTMTPTMEPSEAAPVTAAPAATTATAAPFVAIVTPTQAMYNRLAEGLSAPDEKLWEPITKVGGRVKKLSDTSPLLSIDFRAGASSVDDGMIAPVAALGEHVSQLDLSRTSVTDAGLTVLTSLPRLVKLDLSRSAIGDAGVAHLASLNELRTLNLYETAVTDASLKIIEELPALEAVYLWKSKVSEAGAKKLREARPELKVSTQ
jgi:Planctomycete cytochrome C